MDQFDGENDNDNDFDNGGFRTDLISSLFGHQLAPAIVAKNDSDVANSTTSCPHSVFRGNTCARCGMTNNGTIATIPYWYIYPNMSLTYAAISRIRDANLKTLFDRKKLHLVLDLDHTLVHTRVSWKLTPEDRKFLANKRFGIDHNLPPPQEEVEEDGAGLYKFANGWTKLRPYVRTFLKEASELFEMSVYTLGCRACGWATAKVLDPNGSCFEKWRVIAREDVAGIDKHTKVLDVVPAHERAVLVVDDNVSVWGEHGKKSVIKITPYNFFSYDSPHEDKVRDASPPRKSWSQLNGDEDEQRGELARVLRLLRDVHSAFFDEDGVKGRNEFETRDVREVLQRVVKAQKYSSSKRKNKLKNKNKNKKK